MITVGSAAEFQWEPSHASTGSGHKRPSRADETGGVA